MFRSALALWRDLRLWVKLVLCAELVAGLGVSVSAALGGGHVTVVKPKVKQTPPIMVGSNPLTGVGTAGRVMTFKIDNVGPAQLQQRGLNSADIVYVIQVEGGLSRYLAIYDTNHLPPTIGPIRSARQSDLPILGPYGTVPLVYSGAISGFLPDLARANIINITPFSNSNLFTNGGSSPTYVVPADVFKKFPAAAKAKDVGFRFGALPLGGSPAPGVNASMPAASFRFTWAGGVYNVAVDGHSTPWTATNVIIQHVSVVPGEFTDHNAAQPANEVFSVTTGHGMDDVYRDGEVFHAHWSKPSDSSPTRYGVNLAPGRTWIVLAAS